MEESTGKTGFDPQAEWMNCKGLKFAARWQYVCLMILAGSASGVGGAVSPLRPSFCRIGYARAWDAPYRSGTTAPLSILGIPK
jgi:hypothetical protein